MAGCIVSQTTGTGLRVRRVPDREIITIPPFYSRATSQSAAVPKQTTPGLTLVHLSSNFDYTLRGARCVREKEPYGWRWGIEAAV